MTVLFSDIRSFTSLSEKMTPKENFDFINAFLEHMEPAINSNNGFIDKYIGDAIMALFGKKTDDAIDAALSMRKQLALLNNKLLSENKSPIEIGIGIHTGNLMLGIVGGSERLQGTVISNAVNLASRIEGLTKLYGIPLIITEDVKSNIVDKNKYAFRYIDNVRVLGKKEAVKLYEVIDNSTNPDFCEKLIDLLPDYQKAIDLYLNQEFEQALLILSKISDQCKNDKIVNMYKERCMFFNQKGIPQNWDGVEIINEK
jgi:two-component system sensor histidine kinase ChiS